MIKFGVSPAKTQELLDRMAACNLCEADLEESFIKSSGPGGQHVNKTATCVRLKHRPSETEVKMQQGRSQGLNRFYARRRMCELLEAMTLGRESPEALKRQKVRRQKQRRQRRSREGRPTSD